MVTGKLEQLRTNILVDTGASASLVATRIVSHLQLTHLLQDNKTRITGLSNKEVPTRGVIELDLTLAETTVKHRFIVIDCLTSDVLIGIDIMEKLGMQIDFDKRMIKTQFGRIPFRNTPIPLESRHRVRVVKTTVVPANSISYLKGWIPVTKDNKTRECVVTNSRKLTGQTGACVQNSLASCTNGRIILAVANPLPTDIVLFKNKIVAFADPLVKTHETILKCNSETNTQDYDSTLNYPRLEHAEPEEVTKQKGQWENIDELYSQLGIDKLKISGEEKTKLKTLISEYNHVFSRSAFDLGSCSFYKAEIKLKPNYEAKWVPTRPIPYNLKPHMDREVLTLVDAGMIEPIDAPCPWNSPVFLVSKGGPNNSNYRLVQDMRAVNQQVLDDNFALPNINRLLDTMTECKWLTSMDLTKGFNQLELTEDSKPQTSFSYDGQRYTWKRLVMGNKCSSSQFARAMNLLLSKVPFQGLICFLDDLLIGSNSVDEHLKRLKFVLSRLSWGNLKISPKKTKLFQQEVKFLGYMINSDGLRIDPVRAEAISRIEPPKTRKELQKFLGTANYNRQFVKNFSAITAPLYALLQKKAKFDWDKTCDSAFNEIKTAITTAPVLAIPDYNDPQNSYELIIDTSKTGHGAVLTQIIGGERRTVAFFSKTVAPHNRKLGASRLEFYGLAFALKHFRMYLLGSKHFVVKTDCKALLSMGKLFKSEHSYVQRLLADVQQYNFTIKHIAGKSAEMYSTDYLSRHPIKPAYEVSTQTPTQSAASIKLATTDPPQDIALPVTLEEIREGYKRDETLSILKTWVENGKTPDDFKPSHCTREQVHYHNSFELISLENDILYRTWVDPQDRCRDRKLMIIPHHLVERILYTCHDKNGHMGFDISLDTARRTFYFYHMRKNFKLYCEACLTCARSKQPHSFGKAPLKPSVYTQFGDCIAIDHLERSKTGNARGYKAILTITDLHTNYILAKPVKSTSAEETLKILINDWIARCGVPRKILTDRGTGFTSKLFNTILTLFGTKIKHGVPFKSTTYGAVESQNKRLNSIIRLSLTREQQDNFDQYLSMLNFTLNSLKCTKTGYSANYLVYGKELTAPRDLFLSDDDRLDSLKTKLVPEENNSIQLQAYNMYKNMTEITRKVVMNSQRKAKYMKTAYDKHANGHKFNVGDYCLLLIEPRPMKWFSRWEGPFKITQVLSTHNYIVDVNGTQQVTNLGKMKTYKPNKYTRTRDTDQDKNKENKTSKGRTTTKPPEENDSSSDDDDGPPFPPRTNRRMNKQVTFDRTVRLDSGDEQGFGVSTSDNESVASTSGALDAAQGETRSETEVNSTSGGESVASNSGANDAAHGETRPETEGVQRRTSGRERKEPDRLNYSKLGGENTTTTETNTTTTPETNIQTTAMDESSMSDQFFDADEGDTTVVEDSSIETEIATSSENVPELQMSPTPSRPRSSSISNDSPGRTSLETMRGTQLDRGVFPNGRLQDDRGGSSRSSLLKTPEKMMKKGWGVVTGKRKK